MIMMLYPGIVILHNDDNNYYYITSSNLLFCGYEVYNCGVIYDETYSVIDDEVMQKSS